MSWEHAYCQKHSAEMRLVSVEGPLGDQTARFVCPVGDEETELEESVARDTSHLPVVVLPEPEGLDPLPD